MIEQAVLSFAAWTRVEGDLDFSEAVLKRRRERAAGELPSDSFKDAAVVLAAIRLLYVGLARTSEGLLDVGELVTGTARYLKLLEFAAISTRHGLMRSPGRVGVKLIRSPRHQRLQVGHNEQGLLDPCSPQQRMSLHVIAAAITLLGGFVRVRARPLLGPLIKASTSHSPSHSLW